MHVYTEDVIRGRVPMAKSHVLQDCIVRQATTARLLLSGYILSLGL